MFLWSLYLKKNDFENQVSHANFNSVISVGVISSLLPHLFLNPLEKAKRQRREAERHQNNIFPIDKADIRESGIYLWANGLPNPEPTYWPDLPIWPQTESDHC